MENIQRQSGKKINNFGTKVVKKYSSKFELNTLNRLTLEDPYQIAKKFDKEIKKIKSKDELEKKFPLKYPPTRKTSHNDLLNRNLKVENFKKDVYFGNSKELTNKILVEEKDLIKESPELLIKSTNESSGDEVDVKSNDSEKTISFHEHINTNPMDLSSTINEIERKFSNINFQLIKNLNFGANLILKHKITNGELYLGSNKYKYSLCNLRQFDLIINMINEHPTQLDNKNNEFEVHELGNIINKYVFESKLNFRDHSVTFLVQRNENFRGYHYLSDQIQSSINLGLRVLVHCELGMTRSPALIAFYLRKFYFSNISIANEYISFKRESAGACKSLLHMIENIVLKTS